MIKRHFLLALLLSSTAAYAIDAPNMTEGQWEITTKTKMTGMAMQMPEMPAHTMKFCFNKDDIANGRHAAPQSGPEGKDGQKCEMVENKVSGNTMTYKMVCTGKGKATMTGQMTYAKDSYHGTSKMEMSGGPHGAMTMVSDVSGKRIGDCKK